MTHAAFPLPDVGWDPAREIWSGASQGELRMPRCRGCARIRWYPTGRCADCGEEAVRWTPVSGRGSLFTWVVVRHAFLPQYAGLVPFVSALVSLEEDPRVRLATRIVDVDSDALAIDQPMEVCFRPLRFEGVEGEIVAPLFRPARPKDLARVGLP